MSDADSPELEALFDSIAAEYQVEHETPIKAPETASASKAPEGDVHARLGQMLRSLHNTLRELGYDKALERAVEAIPDAQDRLNYVATLTEQAAVRVLNATEIAQPLQDRIDREATRLDQGWQKLYANELSLEEFKALMTGTRAFLGEAAKNAQATNAQLMEIMMAQDFQDLTGQVIKKIIGLAQELEQQMVNVLLISAPEDKRKQLEEGLLAGPVVNKQGRTDVVTNQEQVDDLLASLGF